VGDVEVSAVPGGSGQVNVCAAIIDTADDTRDKIPQLKARGVKVVIRYLSLGRYDDLPNLRIIDNGTPGTADSEATKLLNSGLALMLVYEWWSNTPAKFVFGLDAQGKPKTGDKNTNSIQVATNEADSDLAAATAQAAAIGFPNAPIYFTIDFDLIPGSGSAQDLQGNTIRYSDNTPVTNDTVVAACTAYFQRLNAKLGKARLGIYAGGWISQKLRNLVTYSWVAQSTGFTDTAAYLRNGTWHVFQQRDSAWFLGSDCSTALDVDTDIQNPSVADIGAFTASGSLLIDAARTQAIFDAHYVATRITTVYSQKDITSAVVNKRSCHNGKPITVSTIAHNCSVCVLADDGSWLAVDMDEDGLADGYVQKAHFVANIKQTPDYSAVTDET
jgi:Domain of unknown function (DUF1906)